MKHVALVCCCLLSGCTPFKTKTHAFFCVGACVHAEQDVEKGEAPEDPAPTDDPEKG